MDKNFMSIAQAQDYLGKVKEHLETAMPLGGSIRTWQEWAHKEVWSEGVTIDGSDDHDCTPGTYTYTVCYVAYPCEDKARIDYRFERCGDVTSGRFHGSPKEAADCLYAEAIKDANNK